MVKQIEDGITSITGAVTTGVALADRQQELMEKTSESFVHIEQKAAHIKAELTQLDGRIIESKQLGEQVFASCRKHQRCRSGNGRGKRRDFCLRA